jgi:hypothetical protein
VPGRFQAVTNGEELKRSVMEAGRALGLQTEDEVKVGRRIWGARRFIDVVLTNASGLKLGLECKYQGTGGSAEEKIPATIEDIKAWPIRGLVVFDGPGFSPNMMGFLISTGMAIEFADLEDWLRLYFSIAPIEVPAEPALDLGAESGGRP